MTKLHVKNGRVTDDDEQLQRCPDCRKITVTEWAYCPHCGVSL